MAGHVDCWYACHLTRRQLNYFVLHLPFAMPLTFLLTSTIYINPDLSPTEAKLAFEARQRRRERIDQWRATDTETDHAVDTVNKHRMLLLLTKIQVLLQRLQLHPTVSTSTGIIATTSPLTDATMQVQTTNMPFRNP